MNPNVWQWNPNFRPRFTIKSCFHRSSQLQSSSTKLTSIYRQNRSVFFPNIYLYIYIYIVLNHPSPGQEQKRFYSRVLQGHLALATAVFPEGTCGLRLGKPWVKPRTNAEKKHGEKVTNMVKSGRLFIVILDGISLSYLFVHYFCWKPWVMKKWSRQTVDKRIIKIINEKGFRTISVIFGSETSFPKAPGCLCAKTFMAGRHGVWTWDWPWHWSLSECTRGSCTEPRC